MLNKFMLQSSRICYFFDILLFDTRVQQADITNHLLPIFQLAVGWLLTDKLLANFILVLWFQPRFFFLLFFCILQLKIFQQAEFICVLSRG